RLELILHLVTQLTMELEPHFGTHVCERTLRAGPPEGFRRGSRRDHSPGALEADRVDATCARWRVQHRSGWRLSPGLAVLDRVNGCADRRDDRSCADGRYVPRSKACLPQYAHRAH